MELHGVTVKKVTTNRKVRHIAQTKEHEEYDEVTVVTQIVLQVEDADPKLLGDLREIMYTDSVEAMIAPQLEMHLK